MSFRNITHAARWENQEAHRESWHERNRILLRMFTDSEFEAGNAYTVAELGCGPHSPLEAIASEKDGFRVRKYDLRQWDDAVTVVDLNDDISAIAPGDICVLSGVLEYIRDVPSLLEELSRRFRFLLFSYAFFPVDATQDDTKYLRTVKARSMSFGWRNHYTNKEIVDIASKLGTISNVSTWNRQSLFLLRTDLRAGETDFG